jgi:hypothetical protein
MDVNILENLSCAADRYHTDTQNAINAAGSFAASASIVQNGDLIEMESRTLEYMQKCQTSAEEVKSILHEAIDQNISLEEIKESSRSNWLIIEPLYDVVVAEHAIPTKTEEYGQALEEIDSLDYEKKEENREKLYQDDPIPEQSEIAAKEIDSLRDDVSKPESDEHRIPLNQALANAKLRIIAGSADHYFRDHDTLAFTADGHNYELVRGANDEINCLIDGMLLDSDRLEQEILENRRILKALMDEVHHAEMRAGNHRIAHADINSREEKRREENAFLAKHIDLERSDG